MLKEKEIRPDDLMKLKEPALEHDKKFLRDRRDSFENTNCPACNSKEFSRWGEKEGFTYVICQECKTIFMNPRASEKLLEEFYKQSKNYEFWNKFIFPQTNEIRKERIFKPRAKATIELCKKHGITGGTILEIGSAYGTYCESIRELNFFDKIIAVEPTPELAQTCRNKNIETIENNVENLSISPETIDVIANFEVIEHLSNPSKFVVQAARYLKKDGLFICTCPNGEGLGTIVLKEKAKVVDHEHINYFNTKSIKKLLNKNSIDVLEITTPGEMDVDLLENAFKEDKTLLGRNTFIEFILLETTPIVKESFQNFLKNNGLSSHMWVVGRKV